MENKENAKYLSFSVSVTRTSSRVASDRILFSANTFDLSPRPICGLQKAVEACCRRVRLGFSARDLSARGRTASRFFPSEKRRNAFRAFSRPRFWGLPCQADAESAHDVNATLFLSFSFSRDSIFFSPPPPRDLTGASCVSGVLGDGGRRSRAVLVRVLARSLTRCSISRAYKSRMGGTDMERHRRGWKETRLSKQRLVEFIAERRRRDRARSPSPSFPSILSPLLRHHHYLQHRRHHRHPLALFSCPPRTLTAVLAGPPSAPPPTYLDIKSQ